MIVGARYRPARKRGPAPIPPPPNLGFPTTLIGQPAVTVPLPPDMFTGDKPLYLQWNANVQHSTGPQGWGFSDFYNAALFAAGSSPKFRFQWNDTDNANTFYLRQLLSGGQIVDSSGPIQHTADKCVAIIDNVNRGALHFSSFRGGVPISFSTFTYSGTLTYDHVIMAGPASNIIARDTIPASYPI